MDQTKYETILISLSQSELESLSSSLASSDSKSHRLNKEVSSLESQLHDVQVTCVCVL